MFAMVSLTGFKQNSNCTLRLRLRQKRGAIEFFAFQRDEQIACHHTSTVSSDRFDLDVIQERMGSCEVHRQRQWQPRLKLR
jgi:hypothetical protein